MDHDACIRLFEQALLLGTRELDALNEGQAEQAAAWEAERSRLTQEALALSGDIPLDVLRGNFQQLCAMQKSLIQAGNELRQRWQQEYMRSRKESRRLAGYKQAAAHALH